MSSTPSEKKEISHGYAEPLFADNKPKWTDERLIGGSVEKTSVRYHNKENVLKITNGLCTDIFFRAADIQREDFKDIPDCAAPAEQKPRPTGPVDYRKPLDSKSKKRTYIISKELPAPAPRRPTRGGPRSDGRRPRRRRR